MILTLAFQARDKKTPERVRERYRSLTAYQYTAAAPQASICEELVASRCETVAKPLLCYFRVLWLWTKRSRAHA